MSIIAYFSAWGVIIGGIWLLFSKAEDTVKPEIKTAISSWLSNLNPEGKLANWAVAFASVFDGIFSKEHYSWRCVSRSCIASFAAVTIITIVWWMVNPVGFNNFFIYLVPGNVIGSIGVYLMAAIVLNTIPDYFSLIETRYIISKMRSTYSLPKTLGFLAIDFVATIIIFVMFTILFDITSIFIIPTIMKGNPVRSSLILDEILWLLKLIFLDGVFFKSGELNVTKAGQLDVTMGVWFYSTFFTSVWVYLYVLSGLIVKVGAVSGILVGRMRRILDIDNKPLRSMGLVCILFVSITFLIVPFVKLLF